MAAAKLMNRQRGIGMFTVRFLGGVRLKEVRSVHGLAKLADELARGKYGTVEFSNEDGPADNTTQQIARLRALWHTLAVLEYARTVEDHDLMREGGESLLHLAFRDKSLPQRICRCSHTWLPATLASLVARDYGTV